MIIDWQIFFYVLKVIIIVICYSAIRIAFIWHWLIVIRTWFTSRNRSRICPITLLFCLCGLYLLISLLLLIVVLLLTPIKTWLLFSRKFFKKIWSFCKMLISWRWLGLLCRCFLWKSSSFLECGCVFSYRWGRFISNWSIFPLLKCLKDQHQDRFIILSCNPCLFC